MNVRLKLARRLERGRGATLTTVGHKLLCAQDRSNARLAPELARLSAQINRELANASSGEAPVTLRVVASHDLALVALRRLFGQAARHHLDLAFYGIFESIERLRAKHYDLAGFHLPEGRLGVTLAGPLPAVA